MTGPRDPWRIDVTDRLCAIVDLLIGLSTGALVLPSLFIRSFLAIPEDKPLLPYLTTSAYVGTAAFAASILLGSVYRYTAAKWITSCLGPAREALVKGHGPNPELDILADGRRFSSWLGSVSRLRCNPSRLIRA